MIVITTVKAMQDWTETIKRDGKTIGFVPTMGFLHEGHLSLAEQAGEENNYTVMSIFVNPLQFGEGEDFEEYPRNLERDKKLARQNGVDVLFVPHVREMYPRIMTSSLIVKKGADVLCGKSRPGHFDGVATVVMKLFSIVSPDRAYFGMKDAQQVAVIENLVKDFHLKTDIVRGRTVREEDGLAKSSRNVNLNDEERAEAPEIYKVLSETKELILKGSRKDSAYYENFLQESLNRRISGTVDYAEIRTFPELEKPEEINGAVIIAAAVKYSTVRLIDNILLSKESEQ